MHFKESASYASLAGNAERRQHPVSFDRGFDWKRAFMGRIGGELPYVISVLANGVTFLLGYLWLQKKKKETSGQERRFSLGAAVKLLAVGVIFQMIVCQSAAGRYASGVSKSNGILCAGAGKSGGVCTVCLFCAVYGGACSFDRGNGLSRRNPADFTRGTALCSGQCTTGRSFCSDAWESCAVPLYAFLAGLLLGTVVKRYGKLSADHMVSFCSQCFRFISGRHQRTWNLSFAGNQFRSSLWYLS